MFRYWGLDATICVLTVSLIVAVLIWPQHYVAATFAIIGLAALSFILARRRSAQARRQQRYGNRSD